MRTYSSETAGGLLSKGLETVTETPGQVITRTDDLFSDMILRAMEEPAFIDELPEDFDEIRSVLVATVEHAKQRDDSPEVRACVSKKIPIIIEDHPEWSREQQIAVAFAMCRKDPKAYEKSVEYEMAEIERLGADLAEAEARGDTVAVAGLRYALGMAEAALEIAEQEEKGKINSQEVARFGPKGMGTKEVKKAGAAPKAAIQAAAAQWEEEKHPRKGGKFAPKGQGDSGAQAQPGAKPQAKPQAQAPAQAPPQQAAASQAPPSPQAAQRPAGRLQQVDMDRVKSAVDTARQALAARIQEAGRSPKAPSKPDVTEQTIQEGKPGFEEAQRAAREVLGKKEPTPEEKKASEERRQAKRAAYESEKKKKAQAEEAASQAKRKKKEEAEAARRASLSPEARAKEDREEAQVRTLTEEEGREAAQGMKHMKRAVAVGLKADKIDEFMSLPAEKREKLLAMAEKKHAASKGEEAKPKAEAPKSEKKPEPKAKDEGLQAARKRAEAAGMSAEDQQAALKLPPLLRDVLISDAEKKKKYQAGEQAVAAKPKAEEKKEPPKAAPKPEAPKEKPKAEAPTKKPEKKPEPRRPSPAQEAARFEAEERRKKAEGGKKKEPTKTEEARRAAARARGGQAFPAGYKFDEDPVAIIERSIEVMLKADVEALKSMTHSLISKHGW